MPKFLGMEPKTYLWVGGGLVALIVVYYVIKSRSGGAGVVAGGDTGLTGGGISGSAPVSYAPNAPDTSGDAYQQQLNDLDVQARQEQLKEMQEMYELQQKAGQQQLEFNASQNALALQGAQQQLAVSGAQANLATAQLGQTTQEVQSGKIKGECGKGESSYFDRNTGEFKCKASGKSGIKTAGDVLGNTALQGVNTIANAYINQYIAGIGAPSKPKSSSGTPTVRNAVDYSTQHAGNSYGYSQI